MVKEKAGKRKSVRSGNMSAAASKRVVDDGLATTVESLFPTGSPQRVAAGVAVASGSALAAAALFGVGPAALAGVAGYLAYRAMGRK